VTTPVLHRLVGANALLVACAVTCGAAIGVMDGRRVVLPSSMEAPAPDIRGNTMQIVRQNGRVWLFVCSTLASFGVAGAALLVANAFRFGVDVATVGLSVPDELTFLAAHGLLEFAAFTLAVAAVQYLGWMLFALLARGEPTGRLAIGLTGLAASAAVGLLAAWVEALSHAARTAGGA
jgi:uncharacterized membrane protein SpoIIM required for sporulation